MLSRYLKYFSNSNRIAARFWPWGPLRPGPKDGFTVVEGPFSSDLVRDSLSDFS